MLKFKNVFAIFSCLLFIILTGCGNTDTLTGKYYYEDSTGKLFTEQYVEFSPDGNADTLTMKNADGEGPLLTYRIEGEEIILEQTSFNGTESETYSFAHEGNSVYINDMKFTKK